MMRMRKEVSMEIGRVSMMVEVNGHVWAVVLPQDRMRMLVNLAASLSDSGKLPVKKLSDDYHFETVTTKDAEREREIA